MSKTILIIGAEGEPPCTGEKLEQLLRELNLKPGDTTVIDTGTPEGIEAVYQLMLARAS